jgi:hypothetical protein
VSESYDVIGRVLAEYAGRGRGRTGDPYISTRSSLIETSGGAVNFRANWAMVA